MTNTALASLKNTRIKRKTLLVLVLAITGMMVALVRDNSTTLEPNITLENSVTAGIMACYRPLPGDSGGFVEHHAFDHE
ncbi:MAG: hypothetical protein ACTSRU_01990 [Candidatus Hodarchaeales archaeon]